MSVLDEIFSNKRLEVAEAMRMVPLPGLRTAAETAPPPPDFKKAVIRPVGKCPRLIAEVKKASPSRGLLTTDFDPARLSDIYTQNGAAAISVLTDAKYFQGSLDDLRIVSSRHPLVPVLRKDFIFDAYQVYEARQSGAAAVLLIAAMIEAAVLRDLASLAASLGMTALVEIHSAQELETALKAGASLIGINNRDLKTLQVDTQTTLRLRPYVPAGIPVVAESGIHTRADVDRLQTAGVDAILVGEALVTAPDPSAKIKELAG